MSACVASGNVTIGVGGCNGVDEVDVNDDDADVTALFVAAADVVLALIFAYLVSLLVFDKLYLMYCIHALWELGTMCVT
jgi:hypothetical protein